MPAPISPRWGFVLVILTCLCPLLGSQRRVVVFSSDDLELRRTAHRLGLGVDKIRQGRKTLQFATDLIPELAGQTSVASLGDVWMALNWGAVA